MLHNPVSFNPVSPGQPMLEAAGDGQRTHRLPFSIESILSIGGPNANRQSCRAPSPDRMPRYRRSCQTSSPARMSRDRSHYQTPSPARMSREKPSCYTQSPARLSREKPDFYTQSPARMSRDRSHYQTPSPARMSREKPSCYTQSPARLSREKPDFYTQSPARMSRDRSHYQTPSPARMSREKPDSNTQSPARMSKDGSRYQTPSPARMPRGRTSGQIQSPVKQSMRRPTWTHQPSPGMPMESSSCCLPPAHAPPYDYQHRLVHNYSPLFYYHQSVHPAMVHPQLTVRVPRGECPCKDPYCSEQVLPYPYCMATTDSSLNWRTRPSKSKRIRTVFTPEQLERLEAEFIKQQYMVGTERVDLAATLNLTETQIKVWFQNRRIKGRKQRVEQKKPKVS